jgi:2'-5' RNA ligase
MHRYVSYWLVPTEAERASFQELVNTLARTYNAPTFVPHVTIYSGESPADETPLEIIARSTPDVHGVRLYVESVSYTEEFTKTLFVQFYPSSLLSQIAENMRRLSARPSHYVLNPHLSLLYKRMSEHEKQHIAATLRLPQSEVFFDAVWAIASPGPTRTPEDVARWEVVCRKPLSTLST